MDDARARDAAPTIRPRTHDCTAAAPAAPDETNAKDVAWPATRAVYDELKTRMAPDGIGEIILTPDGGTTLLEGLTTNLFVARTRVDMPYHGVADAKSSVELVTAPRDSVLPGLARDAVIRASAAEGLPVREEPVLASDADCWTEALLTNAVRLVQPVRRCGGGRATGIRVTGRGRNDSSRIRGLDIERDCTGGSSPRWTTT